MERLRGMKGKVEIILKYGVLWERTGQSLESMSF